MAAVGRLRLFGVVAACAVLGAACTVPGPGGPGGATGCPGGQVTVVHRSTGSALDGARSVSPDGDSVVTVQRIAGDVWRLSAWSTSGAPTLVSSYDHPATGWPVPPVEVSDDGVVHLAVVTADHPFGLRWDPATGAVTEPVAPAVAVPPGASQVELRHVGPTGDGLRLLWAQEYRPPGSGDLYRVTQAIETDNRTDAVLAVHELLPLPGQAGRTVGVQPGSEDGRFVLHFVAQTDSFLPMYGDVDAQMLDMDSGTVTSLSGALDVIPNVNPGYYPFGLFPQAVSTDGRHVVFVQQNPAVANSSASLFVWDVQTSQAQLVTRAAAVTGQDEPRRPVAVGDGGVVTYLRINGQLPVAPTSYQLAAWDPGTSTTRTIRAFTDPTGLGFGEPRVDLAGGGTSMVVTELSLQPPNDAAVALIRCG